MYALGSALLGVGVATPPAASVPAASSRTPGPLLLLSEPWEQLTTHDFSFEKALPTTSMGSFSLELIRALDSQRR